MLFLRLLHFITGFIRFEANGGFPERFLNLCTSMQIPVWDIVPKESTLTGKTKIQSYLRLHRAAKKSGMHLCILQKAGIPFIWHRNKSRFGLLIGCILFSAILFFLSGRIWVIETEGNESIRTDVLLSAMADLGIREGIRSSGFKASDAERKLTMRIPNLSWIALNVDGSVLHVKVREKLSNSPAKDYEHPCHIVASEDGYLVKIETFEGKAAAQRGTAVQKGQLLISGITENLDGSSNLHHAKGYVEAQTTKTLSTAIPKTGTFPSVSTAQKHVTLCFFGLRLPFGVPSVNPDGNLFCYRNTVTAQKKKLPISAEIRQTLFFDNKNTLSKAHLRLLLLSEFEETVSETLYGCRIENADIRIFEDRKSLRADGTFGLLENIGMTSDILLEEQPDDTPPLE